MKQKIWRWVALVFMAAVILSLSSCGGGGDAVYVPPASTMGTIELINDSIVTIDGFYLAPADQNSWGANILSGPLFPKENAFIVDIFSDYYDAKIRTTGAYSLYSGYLYDIPIAAGDILPLYVHNSSFTGSLEIRNNTSGATIIGVYVVPAKAPTWGIDQTSSDIGPSGSLHLYDLAPGLYDVRVVWNIGPDSIDYDIIVDSLTLKTLNVD